MRSPQTAVRTAEVKVFSRLDRYLIKEVMLAFFATVLVLLAILLSHRLAGLLSSAASGRLAKDAIFVMLGLQAIRYMVVLLPAGFLLGAMLALGRLYRDNEMTALTGCGVGPGAVYRPLLLLAMPMAAVAAGLSLYVVPQAVDLYYEMRTQARRYAQVSMFTPGRFQEVDGGRHVIYVGGLGDGGRELRKVFIQSLLGREIAITTAEHGHQEIDPQSGVRYVVLQDGYRYEGFPGRRDYRRVQFQRLSVRMDVEPVEEGWRRRETVPTWELLAEPSAEHVAELHERIGSPISLLLLALLAPLLAHARPREGRYARVVAAVLVYAIYINLLGVGSAWLEHGKVWPALGLWWVHGLLVISILGLALHQYGSGWPAGRGSDAER